MLFDPFELDTSVTPGRIRAALRQRDFTRAILMAFRLNEKKLLQETLESVPWDESERQAQLGQGGGAGGCRELPGSCTHSCCSGLSGSALEQKGHKLESAFLLVEVLCRVSGGFLLSHS